MNNMLKKINEKTNISKNLLGITLFSNSYSAENIEKITKQQNASYINKIISDCVKEYTGEKELNKGNNIFEILNERRIEYINNNSNSSNESKVNGNKRKVSKISAMIREMGVENGELYHPGLSAKQTTKALINAKIKAIKEEKSKIELDEKELEIALENLAKIDGNEKSLEISAYEKNLIMENLNNIEKKTKMEDKKIDSNKIYLMFTEKKDRHNPYNDSINKSTEFSYNSQSLKI